jgi:hypothetical protein
MMEPTENLTSRHRWSRATRLTVYTLAGILTVGFTAAWFAGLGILLARCDEAAPELLPICSENGRFLTYLVCFGGLAAIVFPWIRYLTRALRITEDVSPPTEKAGGVGGLPESWKSVEDVRLPFGQHIVCGKVDSVNMGPGRHLVTVHGRRLRFWGGHALRKGSIKIGDRTSFVYQKIPLFDLKYVLAYSKSGNYSVQSVGGALHAVFLFLATIGASLDRVPKESNTSWLTLVCSALFVESCFYLLLLLIAKRALYGFINQRSSS